MSQKSTAIPKTRTLVGICKIVVHAHVIHLVHAHVVLSDSLGASAQSYLLTSGRQCSLRTKKEGI